MYRNRGAKGTQLMTDIDIITRHTRPFASVYANSEDGKDWIMRIFPIREADSLVTIPSAFVGEYVARIARERLSVRVRSA
jgi:hypothetical protein